MNKLLALIGVMAFTAQASEEITGAFGYKFGDVFDVSRTDYRFPDNHEEGVDDIVIIEEGVEPPFDMYILHLNPENHQIYLIAASKNHDDRCNDNLDAYAQAISDKYGIEMQEDNDYPVKSKYIENERTIIAVACEDKIMSGGLFSITYLDDQLKEMADKATIKIRSNKIDTTNL